MNKFYLTILAMLFAGTCNMQAQVEVEDEDDDEEEYYEDDAPDSKIKVKNAKGEVEEIDLPEAMSTDVDSLLNLYNTRTYLHPDTTYKWPDVNPIYDKDVYKLRLSKLPTVIEMPYNDIVQRFIDRYSSDLRHSVAYMLGAQNLYMPIFEEALESYGLPLELKYLPVIESALNPRAVSRVGATGLWQFMITTAKRYGLKINSLVDERRDPYKASYAAAHYLSDLYKIFGDWNIVIAAYNCGPEKINKAMHRSKKKDYWEIYNYLPQETRGYVPAFIAANYIMNYYCDHNIRPMVADLPVNTDTIEVNRDIHFEQLAAVLGMEVDQIKSLNPQYRRKIVNGNSQPSTLRLPSDMITKFIDNEDSVYNYKNEELLSKRTEVEVDDEMPMYRQSRRAYNHSKRNTSRSKRNKKGKKNRSRGKSVSIKNGDTLSEIAARNHTTVSKLRKLNNIKGNNIRAGKKIRIK
jgi:membrane-bound lytic murein transglycosylase D